MSKLPDPYKFARRVLDGYDATPEEKKELKFLVPPSRDKRTKTNWITAKYVFLLRKKGYGKNKICAIMNIDHRLYERIMAMINANEFLKKAISNANKDISTMIVKQTEQVVELFDKDEQELEEKFQDLLLDKLENKILKLLDGITPDKIDDASLNEIASAFNKIFDKYRLATGQSNVNIATSVKMINADEVKENDIKQIQLLKQEAENIQHAINMLREGNIEPARKIIEKTTKNTEEVK